MDSQELHVYSSECDWVIAYSPEDARIAYDESLGMPREDDDEFTLCDDSAELSILTDENSNISDSGTAVKKTMREWVVSQGRGFLCSTEY